MQYIYFFILDKDSTWNNILKCLHLQSRYAANISLNFFVWSPGLSKLLKSQAVGLSETKNQQGRTFDETWWVHMRISKESKKIRKSNSEEGGDKQKKSKACNRQ